MALSKVNPCLHHHPPPHTHTHTGNVHIHIGIRVVTVCTCKWKTAVWRTHAHVSLACKSCEWRQLSLQRARIRKAEVILQPNLPLFPLCLLPCLFGFFLPLWPLIPLSSFHLHPSLRRAQRGGRLEESGAQLHPVQQHHGLPHMELPPSRWQPGAPAPQLGDGLHWDRHGLLHRVSIGHEPYESCDRWAWKQWVRQLINFFLSNQLILCDLSE